MGAHADLPLRSGWGGLWRSRASYLVIDEQGIHSRYLGQTVPWERVTTAWLTGFNPFSQTLSIGLSEIDAYGAYPERAVVIPAGVLKGDGMDAIKAIYDFPKFAGRRWHKD